MSLVDTIKKSGEYTVGKYTNVVGVDYNIIFLSIAEEQGHPEAAEHRKRMNSRKLLFEEMKETKDKDLRQILEAKTNEIKNECVKWIEYIFKEESEFGHLIFKRSKEIIQHHIKLLKPFGKIIGFDVDTIYFCPGDKCVPLLEENDYFCKDIKLPHSCYTKKAQCMVVYGLHKYALQVQHGNDPQSYRRIYNGLGVDLVARANQDLDECMNITPLPSKS
jgi:hypothetical protein